jgi:hypothetical protein
MAVDRRAAAYAEQFHAIFISRYIAAARAGRADIIPESIRDAIVSYVRGTVPQRPVDTAAWMKDALYTYRVKYGKDYPLPPDYTPESAGKAVAKGALKGAAVGLGIAATLLRFMR